MPPCEARIGAGLAYIPEERMRDGAIREFSVQENVFLHDHASPAVHPRHFLDFARMSSIRRRLVSRLRRQDAPAWIPRLKNLSGGNIQKLIMARELSRKPKVLIAAQPTRGVDIGATRIYSPAPAGAARGRAPPSC